MVRVRGDPSLEAPLGSQVAPETGAARDKVSMHACACLCMQAHVAGAAGGGFPFRCRIACRHDETEAASRTRGAVFHAELDTSVRAGGAMKRLALIGDGFPALWVVSFRFLPFVARRRGRRGSRTCVNFGVHDRAHAVLHRRCAHACVGMCV